MTSKSVDYYSTLTSDLGASYRRKMAMRLTGRGGARGMSFTELKIMSTKDSVETLGRLLGLRREEIFRNEQEQALALVGFRKKTRTERNSGESELAAIKAAERYLVKKRREAREATRPRFYDPDARMSANAPGPGGYDTFRPSKSQTRVAGGSSFGASTSQRGGFLGTQYKEAVRQAEMERQREEEEKLEASRRRQAAANGGGLDGGSEVLTRDVRRHQAQMRRSHHSASATSSAGLMSSFGQESLRRGEQIRAMGKRQYMVSSGPRTNLGAVSSFCRSAQGLMAAPVRNVDHWSSPGPRYNVRQKLVSNIPGKTIGIGAKFSRSARPSMVRRTAGPGPVYQPNYSVVDKNRPNTTMCPRRTVGSIAPGSDGPGPVYYPGYDNKGTMGSSHAFSFADYKSRGGAKTRRVTSVGGPVPEDLLPAVRKGQHASLTRRAKSTGALGRGGGRGGGGRGGGRDGSHGRGQQGVRAGSAVVKPGKRPFPHKWLETETNKQQRAEAEMREIRDNIWRKLRESGHAQVVRDTEKMNGGGGNAGAEGNLMTTLDRQKQARRKHKQRK